MRFYTIVATPSLSERVIKCGNIFCINTMSSLLILSSSILGTTEEREVRLLIVLVGLELYKYYFLRNLFKMLDSEN